MSSMYETDGDSYAVECPYCGEVIRDMWDYGNRLAAGMEFECPHCNEPVIVSSTYTTTTVSLDRKRVEL